jgi:hypothetical protein
VVVKFEGCVYGRCESLKCMVRVSSEKIWNRDVRSLRKKYVRNVV